MKSEELAPILAKMAVLCAAPEKLALEIFGELLGTTKTPTIAAVIKTLLKVKVETPERSSSEEPFSARLQSVLALIEVAGKPAVIKDLQSVCALFDRFPATASSQVAKVWASELSKPAPVKPVANNEVVQRHVETLEGALGNDNAFQAACRSLDSDTAVGPLEIAEISKLFAKQKTKSKPAAMKKIWARHHSIMSSKAKLDSRDGRSAA